MDQQQQQHLVIRFDEGDMVKIAAIVLVISIIGNLCARWIAAKW